MCEGYLVFNGWIIFHCVYTTLCLSIHLLNAGVASSFWLLWIMVLWIWDTTIQFLVLNILGVFPGQELMDSVLTLCLFLRSPLPFSAAVALFYYIPLYGRVIHLMDGSTLFCLFIHLLVGIFSVFTLGCWEQCCYEYWCTTLYLNNCFKFFVCMSRSGASETYNNYISIFLRKCWSFTHTDCTVLHIHE